ncbi:MAG: hypothetical protein Q8K36_01520 [Alphaproteobacteria bacterium]|nr:hypothetical protein [Alphaproteobacteria bacterium]
MPHYSGILSIVKLFLPILYLLTSPLWGEALTPTCWDKGAYSEQGFSYSQLSDAGVVRLIDGLNLDTVSEKIAHSATRAAFKDNPNVENWRQVSMTMVGLGSAAETLGAVSDLVDVAKSIGRKGLRTLGVVAPFAQDIMSCAEGATVFAQPLSAGVRKIEATAARGYQNTGSIGQANAAVSRTCCDLTKTSLGVGAIKGATLRPSTAF